MADSKVTDSSFPPSHWQQGPTWWQWLGSPLRPDLEDLAILEKTVVPPLHHRSETGGEESQVCLLGVTPELATLPWPEGNMLIAIDHAAKMIESVWVGDRWDRKAVFGDWRSLPLESHSCDLVLGDGCLTLVDYPQGYRTLFQEIERVLKPQGYLSLRCFLRPETPEGVEQLFEDLWAGKIANFHGFKLRLAMALQQRSEMGVAVAQVWQCWQHFIPKPSRLFQHLGWPVELQTTIAMYQHSPAYYTFPTFSEVQDIIAPEFQLVECHTGTYDLSDRCPTLIFAPTVKAK